MTNVLKIFKDNKVLFTSEYKTIQASIVGEKEFIVPASSLEEVRIPHNLGYRPICMVYAITDIFTGGERVIECPFPAAVGGGSFIFSDYKIEDDDLVLLATNGAASPLKAKFKYFIIPHEIKTS